LVQVRLGTTAAIYAARANLRPVRLRGGGDCRWCVDEHHRGRELPWFPGAGIMGPDLMEAMRSQAERFGAQMVRDDVRRGWSLTGPVKTVTDGEGTSWSARTVILAMGSAYRRMGIADETRLSGHGVSWCATCDGFFFPRPGHRGRRRRDSAVEEATFLTKFAASVTDRAPPRRAARFQRSWPPRDG